MKHTMNRYFAAGLMLVVLAGCGGRATSREVVAVRGTVTIDGKPLPDALVEFEPQSGRPSSAVTDAQGNYELLYSQSKKGAVAGTHTVKITTGKEQIVQEGKVVQKAISETIPAQYNASSQLTAEVVPGKPLDFKFELTSK